MASKFESAFAAARKAGKKEFTFNGKKYNTELKETVRPKARSSASTGPKPRPMSKKEANNAKVDAGIKRSNDAKLARQSAPATNTNTASKEAVKKVMNKAAGANFR